MVSTNRDNNAILIPSPDHKTRISMDHDSIEQ